MGLIGLLLTIEDVFHHLSQKELDHSERLEFNTIDNICFVDFFRPFQKCMVKLFEYFESQVIKLSRVFVFIYELHVVFDKKLQVSLAGK